MAHSFERYRVFRQLGIPRVGCTVVYSSSGENSHLGYAKNCDLKKNRLKRTSSRKKDFTPSTAGQSGQVVGALATCYRVRGLLQDEEDAASQDKDCARNTSVQSCGHAGGLERKVALCALRFQNQKINRSGGQTDVAKRLWRQSALSGQIAQNPSPGDSIDNRSKRGFMAMWK